VTRFDLESPRDLHRLDDPLFALENLAGLVVLDPAYAGPGSGWTRSQRFP
jgi:hypothetical protein